MPPEKKIGVLSSFQERHPKIYTFLYQILLLIITFYCAIAIARYGPESDTSTAPASLATVLVPRLNNTNSTTPHICKYGAREDLVDLGPVKVVLSRRTPRRSSPECTN
jgi:hypothetical protein